MRWIIVLTQTPAVKQLQPLKQSHEPLVLSDIVSLFATLVFICHYSFESCLKIWFPPHFLPRPGAQNAWRANLVRRREIIVIFDCEDGERWRDDCNRFRSAKGLSGTRPWSLILINSGSHSISTPPKCTDTSLAYKTRRSCVLHAKCRAKLWES